MVDIADTLAGLQQQAENIRNVGVYDQRGGYQQSINQTAKSAQATADIGRATDELLTDMSTVQQRLLEEKKNMDLAAIDHQTQVLGNLAEKNEGLTAVRQKAVQEISEDTQRMASIQEDDTGFFENPFKFIGNKIRYSALRGEVVKDTERANMVTRVINNNYNSASRSISEYKNTVYMRNATLLRHRAAIAQEKANLRKSRIGLANRQNETNQKAAAFIASQTRNMRQDTGIDASELGNPVLLAMHELTGNGDRQMTINDARAHTFNLENSSPEFKKALTRAVNFKLSGEGPLTPEDYLADVTQNGTVGELGAMATLMPSREVQTALASANRMVSNEIYEQAQNDYIRSKGIAEQGDSPQVSREKLQVYLQRNPDASEELKLYQQQRAQEYQQKPAVDFIGTAFNELSSRTNEVISWDGSDLTPQTLASDPDFINEVVSQYMPAEQFMQVLSDDTFRTGMEGSTSVAHGLAEKTAFMTDYFIENADMSASRAAELSSTLATSINKGKFAQQYPEIAIYQDLLGHELDFSFKKTIRSGWLNPENDLEFDLTKPVDVLNMRARKQRESSRVQQSREQIRESSRAFDLLNPGYGFVPQGGENQQGN